VLLMADERERHPVRCEFGPLPLVRRMLGLAMLSLLVLLGVSISAEVSNVNVSKSLLELSGYPLLMVEAFLVSAASLGACFANLQRINTVISDGTYDPRFQSTYWTRWVMGVISGVILSQIVFDFFLHTEHGEIAQAAPIAIGQPLLALLGGYSVDFVHGILKRAINTFGNFFGLSMDDGADNRRPAGTAEAMAQERLATASELAELQRALPANSEMDEISKRLDGLIQRISPKASRGDAAEDAPERQYLKGEIALLDLRFEPDGGHDLRFAENLALVIDGVLRIHPSAGDPTTISSRCRR
jgi:hypothetical protein